MSKSVTIAGATYSDVPALQVRSGAGTALFYDCVGSKEITENGTHDVTGFAQAIVNIAGGLPSGFQAIAMGEYTVTSAFTTTRQTITHNLGVVPDLVLFWHEGNVAQTYSMLWALRFSQMGYRSSAYTLFAGYHGNSTTSVTNTNSNSTAYGVSNLTATTFQIASIGATYYWRAGTYKWLAIKFS